MCEELTLTSCLHIKRSQNVQEVGLGDSNAWVLILELRDVLRGRCCGFREGTLLLGCFFFAHTSEQAQFVHFLLERGTLSERMVCR